MLFETVTIEAPAYEIPVRVVRPPGGVAWYVHAMDWQLAADCRKRRRWRHFVSLRKVLIVPQREPGRGKVLNKYIAADELRLAYRPADVLRCEPLFKQLYAAIWKLEKES